MQWIEYKQCRIAVAPAAQAAGCWGARYQIAHESIAVPVRGVFEGGEMTAEEAFARAMRVVKVAIDEAPNLPGEPFAASLRQLNERFVL
ncbi:hypothetical protein [uncultured Oxalicibacterium sp.]|uniref:hypothetical protein n=1 Tax=uncultured Oxalicibacterium sp. TaxID=1168540 RepID=UPI0025EC15FC|nr:hypothetical protein [uncultured Oxalicibacterium sp.]